MEIDLISKEFNCAEHEYMNMSPSLIALATPLMEISYARGRLHALTILRAFKRGHVEPLNVQGLAEKEPPSKNGLLGLK